MVFSFLFFWSNEVDAGPKDLSAPWLAMRSLRRLNSGKAQQKLSRVEELFLGGPWIKQNAARIW
jgi:hypothetical protein